MTDQEALYIYKAAYKKADDTYPGPKLLVTPGDAAKVMRNSFTSPGPSGVRPSPSKLPRRNLMQEYSKHTLNPDAFVGPRDIWNYVKGYFYPSKSVGYADPVPRGTRIRAFFSSNPAAIIDKTPIPPGRKRNRAR